MARANRLSGDGRDGGIFHITHRCHNKEFLLKFARDRDAYRETIRKHLKQFKVWLLVLDYCLTRNHEWDWSGYHEIMGLTCQFCETRSHHSTRDGCVYPGIGA